MNEWMRIEWSFTHTYACCVFVCFLFNNGGGYLGGLWMHPQFIFPVIWGIILPHWHRRGRFALIFHSKVHRSRRQTRQWIRRTRLNQWRLAFRECRRLPDSIVVVKGDETKESLSFSHLPSLCFPALTIHFVIMVTQPAIQDFKSFCCMMDLYGIIMMIMTFLYTMLPIKLILKIFTSFNETIGRIWVINHRKGS